MDHRQILPEEFTPTIGAYSHGTSFDIGDTRILFTTGQIAMGTDGEVVSEDISEQTEYVFSNLQKILAAEGMDFSHAVKVQIFVTDMSEFSKISPIRNRFLGKAKPVSTLVEVNKLVKEGCRIEIEITAIKKM